MDAAMNGQEQQCESLADGFDLHRCLQQEELQRLGKCMSKAVETA
jgi:hypothetical protein